MAPALLTPPSSGSETSPLAGRKANISKKRRSRKPHTGKFTWKNHHRRTLLVCRQRNLSSHVIAKVFNTLYSEACDLAGYQDGIAQATLNAQWQESKKEACRSWQQVLASTKAELEESGKEIDECLVNNPSYVQPTPTTRQRASKPRWNITTADDRVQTFSVPETPCHTAATATDAYDEDTFHVATVPLTPPVSPRLQVGKSTQEVSMVIDTATLPVLAKGTQPIRQILKKSPRASITAERTRTISGQQVPIIRATDSDLVVHDPVTPAEAHSAVPELLFRFYDDHSQGVRTQDGEICGRYAYQSCRPPSPLPCGDDGLFVSTLSHLNQDETGSELISTTSNLFFAMRLAAKSNANPHIYVIRGSAMPRQKIYHLKPYHKRFKKEKLFIGAKYRNPSSHEYALWATLPRTAIICNFAFADLERHLIGNPYMASIFRIHEMRTRKGKGTIIKGFKEDKLHLTLAAIEAIAKLMPQFGIKVTTSAPVIAKLILELIRGFVIDLPKTTPAQWDILGGAFAYALSYYANQTDVTDMDLIRAKEAFLSGARNGCGEINWHLDPKKQVRMIKKGLSLGLGVNQTEVDTVRLDSARRFQENVARFAYNEKDMEPGQDTMMDEDDTLVDDDDDSEDENEDEDEDDEDTLVESADKEAVTDNENTSTPTSKKPRHKLKKPSP
ncbi:hypothetical protein E4T44_04626 [Aureobasidium sp. EXF-8845]|nr:hypothetical protein E4T44_04626 [Aureobasidium sp. EXF-8845]KAI4852817.1 hypothetical protein E4T45_04565 [Aureobasidium sp. EXF-8846]